MKRFLFIVLILMSVVLCVTSCDFYTETSGDANGDSSALSIVEEMMIDLSQKQLSDAKDLMHPSVVENSDEGLKQLSDYMEGHKVISIQQTDSHIKSSNGTSGKIRQEQLTCIVTLDNGEDISLLVSYLSDDDGAGFTSFQIVLGIE